MSIGSLSDLQTSVLRALAGISPPWVLTGGGSLAGFHLGHRTTRDLDLLFREQVTLDPTTLAVVERRLVEAGLTATPITRSPAFVRYQVERGEERTVLDLEAEPVAPLEPPEVKAIGDTAVLVDSRHEILTNKLTALLSREELRDLVDIQALLAAGVPLDPAIADAPKKDAGFSPLILADLLRRFPLERSNRVARLSDATIEQLRAFAVELSERCLRAVWPDRQ